MSATQPGGAGARPILLTMGDPSGIGPEISVGAWRALRAEGPAFVLVAAPALVRGAPVRVVETADASGFKDALPVLPVTLAAPALPGRPDPANAAATVAAIERAVSLVLAGDAGAVVTNPINKAALYAAGFGHPGHTEFLAALTGAARAVMMLVGPSLRVVPVTIHLPLREAIAALSTAGIVATARVAADALRRDFGIARPRLAIAGLNPHAGESGALGREDAEIVAPAVAALRETGIDASGPWPPDAMFTAAARAGYDAAIGMYHDQVLIPLKALDVAHGVNCTLGLPIIRTSPDHGTAYDIAGTGRADPSSLIASIRLAAEIAARRAAA